MDDTVWVPTVLTKNRERLAEHDAIIAFFNEVVTMADEKGWLSGEHFSVDGTLIGAWAGHKSFVRKAEDDHDDSATTMATSRDSPAATRSMHRRPIRMRGCIVRARPPANCDSWDIPQATIKQLVWCPANKQSAAAVDKRGL